MKDLNSVNESQVMPLEKSLNKKIFNKTPAQAFTPPAEKNMSTASGGLS